LQKSRARAANTSAVGDDLDPQWDALVRPWETSGGCSHRYFGVVMIDSTFTSLCNLDDERASTRGIGHEAGDDPALVQELELTGSDPPATMMARWPGCGPG
jgi:hypothetical protein